MNIFNPLHAPSPLRGFNPLSGIDVYVRPYPTALVQAKTHRRQRINKKWRKRYGMKTVRGSYDPEEVLRIGAKIYAYPEAIETIKKAIGGRAA